MDAAATLDACLLFARLAPDARRRLAALAVPRDPDAGDMLVHQGDPCPGVFVVGRGLVRVYKLAPSGKEHVLHLAAAGATFAEAAVIGRFDCPAYAQAVEDSDLVMIPADPFRAFLDSDHRACIDLLIGLSSWLHHVVDLLEDVVLRDAAGRVSRHLLACAGDDGVVHLPGARKLLANQLNLTPETLSRTLRRLDDDRCISSEREAIVILDRGRLEAVAAGLFPVV